MAKKPLFKKDVVFLNARTCGINKDGGTRYKVDPFTGSRSKEIDNELIEQVDAFLAHGKSEGMSVRPLKEVEAKGILVPRYYDDRWDAEFNSFIEQEGLEAISIGELAEQGILKIRGGHGSPSNDQRMGTVPYIKVSDIRSLRMNINPTNLIPLTLAEKIWRRKDSGLKAWDLITPNRASSNIGEFAIILPGEERVVVTKEVFVFRIEDETGLWDSFYLLWALCLRSVRRQWQRVTLMQTNREDVADRYKEIRIPKPKDAAWAKLVSKPFRDYFTTISEAKKTFIESISQCHYEFIANITKLEPVTSESPEEEVSALPTGQAELINLDDDSVQSEAETSIAK